MKQKPTETGRKIEKPVILDENFNTPLTLIDRMLRQKESKIIEGPNNIIN